MSTGEIHYGGFWRRLGAELIDLALVMVILAAPASLLQPGSAEAYWALQFVVGSLATAYTIFFHARFGQTVGKKVMGLRLKRVDLTPVRAREAWARSSVDLLLFFIGLATLAVALSRVDFALVQSMHLSMFEPFGGDQRVLEAKVELQKEFHLYQPGYSLLSNLGVAWGFSEVITLLFNRKRRALHDFIAGTVVVRE